MCEFEENIEMIYSAEKSQSKKKKRFNKKSSLAYSFLYNCLLIFGCISVICFFYLIGGIFINPLLLFGTILIILLLALIETMNIFEKNNPHKEETGDFKNVKEIKDDPS